MKDRVCLRKRSAPRGPHVITYSATLDVPADTATLLTELLVAERLRRGTGVGSRAASCSAQAVLVLRWFREDADMRVLAGSGSAARDVPGDGLEAYVQVPVQG